MYHRRMILGICSLLWVWVALPSQASADEFQDQVERADGLMKDEQYQQALTVLQEAYAIRQTPRLLYQIAKAQQRLGLIAEARQAYQRYLTAEDDPESPLRADAEAQLAGLRRFFDAPRPEAPPVRRGEWLGLSTEKRPSAALITGGAVLLGVGYTGSLVTGSVMLLFSGSSTCSDCAPSSSPDYARIASGTLLIPVVGPLISALVYRSAAWSIPLAMLDFVAQAGGLTMIIVGAKVKHTVPVIGDSLLISPYGTQHEGGLQAMGRF